MRNGRIVVVFVAAGLFSACTGGEQPPRRASQPSSPAARITSPVEAHVVHRDEARDLPTFAWLSTRPGANLAARTTPTATAWDTLRAVTPVYRLGDAAQRRPSSSASTTSALAPSSSSSRSACRASRSLAAA